MERVVSQAIREATTAGYRLKEEVEEGNTPETQDTTEANLTKV